MKKHRLILLVIAGATALFSGTLAQAMPIIDTFTNSAVFNQVIDDTTRWKHQQTITFDSIPAGQLLPSGSTLFGSGGTGVQFNYFIAGLDMKVATGFDTTSGNRYLGLGDPGNFDQFIAGDTFSLAFSRPINALGMFFITGDPLFDGDIQLVTALGSAENSATEEYRLGDGGFAYFVGLASFGNSFANAAIRFNPDAAGTFLFNVDDITTAVSEPNLALLFCTGLVLITFLPRCHHGHR